MSDRTVDKRILPPPAMLLVCLVVWSPASVLAATDESSRYLELIEAQARLIENLQGRVAALEASAGRDGGEEIQRARPSVQREPRDAVGDLNNQSQQAGAEEVSVTTVGDGISLAIGGFVKTLAIGDSDAESIGADLLPAQLGNTLDDDDGSFSLDSTMTRIYLDGIAEVPGGKLRGYFETDLNDGNDGDVGLNIRHAYGAWENRYGTLLAGQTWSTFMDLKMLPQAISEPTFSGTAFTRQPQIRWSQQLGESFTWRAALEDSNSDDVFNLSDVPSLGQTRLPDAVMGLEYGGESGHIRLNALVRELRVDLGPAGSDKTFAGGLALTGSLNLSPEDRVNIGSTIGEGLGRYLLGIRPVDGASIDPVNNKLKTRDNFGLYGNYTHKWSDVLSGSIMIGYAESDPLSFDSEDTLDNTSYGAANLIWSALPYLSIGVEYGYAYRENKGGDDFDNHRLMLGVQVY